MSAIVGFDPPQTISLIGTGYEGVTIDAYLSQVGAARVEVVVDVRLHAISRKPGFSKRALGAALHAHGVEYRHDSRLGNPRENRAAYAHPGSLEGDGSRERFRDRLRGGDGMAAILSLVELASTRSVALLCFEADQSCCHRQQIIDAVIVVVASRSRPEVEQAD